MHPELARNKYSHGWWAFHLERVCWIAMFFIVLPILLYISFIVDLSKQDCRISGQQMKSKREKMATNADLYHLELIWSGGESAKSTKVYSYVDKTGQQDFHHLYMAENLCMKYNNYYLAVDSLAAYHNYSCNSFDCVLYHPIRREGDSELEFIPSSYQNDCRKTITYSHPTYLTNTLTRSYHPDHWSYPLFWLYSILGDRRQYQHLPIPSELTYAYQLSDFPTNMLYKFWKIFIQTYHLEYARMLWYPDLHKYNRLFCFEEVYFSPLGILHQGRLNHITEFREKLTKSLRVGPISKNVTEVRNAVFLMRNEGNGQRTVLNAAEIIQYTKANFGIDLTVQYINSSTLPHEQARIFNSVDLIVSSHSSQMFNMVFSRFDTTIIELIPKFYSGAFAYRAPRFGLNYKVCEGGIADWQQCGSKFIAAEARMKTGVLCNFTYPIPLFHTCLSEALQIYQKPKSSK